MTMCAVVSECDRYGANSTHRHTHGGPLRVPLTATPVTSGPPSLCFLGVWLRLAATARVVRVLLCICIIDDAVRVLGGRSLEAAPAFRIVVGE